MTARPDYARRVHWLMVVALAVAFWLALQTLPMQPAEITGKAMSGAGVGVNSHGSIQ